jgi:hypothetical protein
MMSKEMQLALDAMRREHAETLQRAATLEAAIAEFERTMAKLDGNYVPAPAATRKEFAGATLREAAEVLLKRAQGPVATRQLCNALVEGGFPTTARDFYMVVYGGLKEMDNFVRTAGGQWLWREGAKAGSQDGKKAMAAGRAR